ncbi:MAG: alanine racemase [Pseudomonadota bacterium]
MGTGSLTIDLNAVAANWRALDKASGSDVETAAVVKANGYGLGIDRVATTLAKAGARKFFVAVAEEGVAVREALGPGPEIFVFSGHMEGDSPLLRDAALIPTLNAPQQISRHFQNTPDAPFAIQLDTGMNRLGIEPPEWAALKPQVLEAGPVLVMSHLACADEPLHAMNAVQCGVFRAMTEEVDVPLSLSATGGILLGPEYHFGLTRPGIGLYGGMPFEGAEPVVRLSLPVIQIRDLQAGEPVGYGNTWKARDDAKIATVSGGYADGLIRHLSSKATLYAGETPCPLVGRVSMDLLTIDVTHLDHAPDHLDILCPAQTVDDLAVAAETIGYEILTSLGTRYQRTYLGPE